MKISRDSHEIIAEFVENNCRVLDVGCAYGDLGALLKEKGCYVVGVEIDEARAKEASQKLDEVVVGDIEKMDLEKKFSKPFDVIVLGDILEHLVDPEAVLTKVRRILIDNGYIVVSLPSIGYWRARAKIFLGKFEYTSGGVFEKTHLRFFTYSTAKHMIEKCGYKVVAEAYTYQPWGWKGLIDRILIRLRKQLGAFQFVFKAVKTHLRTSENEYRGCTNLLTC